MLIDYEKFVKFSYKSEPHLKPLDVLIFSCEDDDFDKHANVFLTC